MVDQLEEVIVRAYDGTWFEDYKKNWSKYIFQYFDVRNIAHVGMYFAV